MTVVIFEYLDNNFCSWQLDIEQDDSWVVEDVCCSHGVI